MQIDETEILMEWITVTDDGDTETAPRRRPGARRSARWSRVLRRPRDALTTLVQAGLVHGDLSPYNTWRPGDRLVIIDLPQMVDLVGNPRGMDFLMRDCANMCAWFRSRGLEVDEQDLFGELIAHAF